MLPLPNIHPVLFGNIGDTSLNILYVVKDVVVHICDRSGDCGFDPVDISVDHMEYDRLCFNQYSH